MLIYMCLRAYLCYGYVCVLEFLCVSMHEYVYIFVWGSVSAHVHARMCVNTCNDNINFNAEPMITVEWTHALLNAHTFICHLFEYTFTWNTSNPFRLEIIFLSVWWIRSVRLNYVPCFKFYLPVSFCFSIIGIL